MSTANKTNIYLFHGPDTFRSLKTLKEWEEKFIKKNGKGSVRKIEGQQEDLVKLSEYTSGTSLFNSTTLLIARNPFKNKGRKGIIDEEDLLNLIEKGIPNSNHLLLWQSGSMDKRLSLTKNILKSAKKNKIKVYEYDFLPEGDALKNIAFQLKKHNLKIKRDAAQALFQFTSTEDGLWNSGLGYNAIKQLAAYCDGKEVVAKDDVVSAIPPASSEDAFLPVLKTFGRRDIKSFVQNLDTLVKNSDSDHELLGAISALFNSVKNMIAVKYLQEQGKNVKQMDEILGFKKGRSRYLTADAKNFSRLELEALLDRIIQVEYDLKTGNTVAAPALSNILN